MTSMVSKFDRADIATLGNKYHDSLFPSHKQLILTLLSNADNMFCNQNGYVSRNLFGWMDIS